MKKPRKPDWKDEDSNSERTVYTEYDEILDEDGITAREAAFMRGYAEADIM